MVVTKICGYIYNFVVNIKVERDRKREIYRLWVSKHAFLVALNMKWNSRIWWYRLPLLGQVAMLRLASSCPQVCQRPHNAQLPVLPWCLSMSLGARSVNSTVLLYIVGKSQIDYLLMPTVSLTSARLGRGWSEEIATMYCMFCVLWKDYLWQHLARHKWQAWGGVLPLAGPNSQLCSTLHLTGPEARRLPFSCMSPVLIPGGGFKRRLYQHSLLLVQSTSWRVTVGDRWYVLVLDSWWTQRSNCHKAFPKLLWSVCPCSWAKHPRDFIVWYPPLAQNYSGEDNHLACEARGFVVVSYRWRHGSTYYEEACFIGGHNNVQVAMHKALLPGNIDRLDLWTTGRILTLRPLYTSLLPWCKRQYPAVKHWHVTNPVCVPCAWPDGTNY